MSNVQNVLYLHGFASGPSSTKATFFIERLHKLGIQTAVPDLNFPSFDDMTLTSQLEISRDCLQRFGQNSKSIIIGSSMGGLLATLLAKSVIPLQGLILLAPGIGLPRRWSEMLGDDGLRKWKETGKRDVFHYGTNTNQNLNYQFIVDAENYSTDNLTVAIPTLVFHGRHDETVPFEESVQFAKLNPSHVRLIPLDDDHTLYGSMELMWTETEKFLNSI